MGKYKVCICCHNELPLIRETGMCGPCTFGSSSMTGEGELIPLDKGEKSPTKNRQLELTRAQMDKIFRAEKGWKRHNNQGWEYVYEYCVPKTYIRIKVSSSVSVYDDKTQPIGTDVIRIYAILYKEATGNTLKQVSGLCKSISVERTAGWEDRVKDAYKKVLAIAMSKSRVRH